MAISQLNPSAQSTLRVFIRDVGLQNLLAQALFTLGQVPKHNGVESGECD